MIISEEDWLAHYGTPRHSGRYPWGSGDDPSSTRNPSFLDQVAALRAKGMSETDIAVGLGLKSSTELRQKISIETAAERQAKVSMAVRLSEKGMSNVAIGERMGINESSVRALLKASQQDKADVLQTTAGMLREQVAKKTFVDVGAGTELSPQLGITKTKLNAALRVLQEEGYAVHNVQVDQVGTKSGQKTLIKVLAPPGTTYRDIVSNPEKIQLIDQHTDDGGRGWLGIRAPQNVASSRIAIRYADEGGADADGVIYLRPGVKDIDLGGARYAQVRIQVDGTHYLKGMAMYKDDLPPGVDLLFNTNKKNTGNKLDAMKELKKDVDGNVDKDNPFGAVIQPGGQRGALNILREEGNWDTWSRTMSSQLLSKQSPLLAKTQLDLTYRTKKDEFDEIMSLTNPTVRKRLLESFADSADSSAVHLEAAKLPRSSWHVLLPMNSLKETEIYAPNFRDGEKVALIRYPHGGTFEIPELTVNNRHPQAKKALGQARDAVAINSKIASRLSGADFDGDAVLVIPNNDNRVKSSSPLQGLKNFDPQTQYAAYPGMPKIKEATKQNEMGKVSNLITDMTIKGASHDEIARAVRHSMVVIDAEKHHLNYKQSAIDNNIPQLEAKYQRQPDGRVGGASTLISRAESRIEVPHRKMNYQIDRATGKKIYFETGETKVERRVRKDGTVVEKVVPRTTTSKKLAETDDAHTLSSGTPIEKVYADHSNKLKAMANQARKEAVNTKGVERSSSAAQVYKKEVASLDAKLALALRNAPRERQAQLLANQVYQAKRKTYPDMSKDDIKKIKYQALQEARNRTGAKKATIKITPEEWNAIQAGAISNTKLTQILQNSDLDAVKKLATPRTSTVMTPAKAKLAEAKLRAGYTQAEIADQFGVSVSTLMNSVGGVNG